MFHSEYISMFKTIAENNSDINHSDSNISFTRILKSTSEPFEDKLYLEEFINKNFRNLKYPCLAVFSYNHGYQGSADSPLNKVFNGAFSILEKAAHIKTSSTDQYDSLETACDSAEKISEDVLQSLSTALIESGCTFIDLENIYAEKSGPDINNIVAQTVYFSFTIRTSITL